MTTAEKLQLTATIIAALSAVSSWVATFLSRKNLKMAGESQARSIAAQNRVNEILEEDNRYRRWIEEKLAEWHEKGWTQPQHEPANLDERRYLSRALREGVLQKPPGGAPHTYRFD